MSQRIWNARMILLPCLAALLAGCMHPVTPAMGPRPVASNPRLCDPWLATAFRQTKDLPAPRANASESGSEAPLELQTDPKTPAANTKKEPQGLQLADGLFQAFAVFTGH